MAKVKHTKSPSSVATVKKTIKHNKVNVAAGAAGAVLGAAVGATAGVILSDDKMKQKAVSAIEGIKETVPGVLEAVNNGAEQVQQITEKANNKKETAS